MGDFRVTLLAVRHAPSTQLEQILARHRYIMGIVTLPLPMEPTIRAIAGTFILGSIYASK